MTKIYHGRQFPAKMKEHFNGIDQFLAKQQVPVTIYQLARGGRVYIIAKDHLEHLPRYSGNRVLKDGQTWFYTYKISETELINILRSK